MIYPIFIKNHVLYIIVCITIVIYFKIFIYSMILIMVKFYKIIQNKYVLMNIIENISE